MKLHTLKKKLISKLKVLLARTVIKTIGNNYNI